jgi:hypothetical protein
MNSMSATAQFLAAKARGLSARARRLSRLDPESVGLRGGDIPYSPSPAHFAAANARLAEIDASVRRKLDRLTRGDRRAPLSSDHLLARAALVEREVDRARRAYGLFFEVMAQRGTSFAPALAACDAIAADCFRVVRVAAPGVLRGPLLKPITYLEHGFSPATFRRGVMLARLLGERNPFPLVRVPFERVYSPWGMGVLLHEVGHNLQADMHIWQETRLALQRRVLQVSRDPWIARIWSRWHKEIFADLIALLLGGPASARSMLDFLAYPAPRVLSFRPLGVHPTPYIRAFIMAEMLDRMGFPKDAARLREIWTDLYGPDAMRSRIPARLLETAPRLIPHVIDEVAYQTRRGLGQQALADVVPFRAADEQEIRRAALSLSRGRLPGPLPPRFLVSASRYAFDDGRANPRLLSSAVLGHLAGVAARNRERPLQSLPKAA